MRKAALLTVAALLTLSLALAGCGGGSGSGKAPSEENFAVREAITDALATDRSRDQEARNIIASVKAGTMPLQQGLDTLVGQTSTVLSLISQVADRPKPPNATLTRAQTTMQDYLRQREFQLEPTIESKSGPEAEAAYASVQQAVDAARQKVRALLIEYDPELEKSLP